MLLASLYAVFPNKLLMLQESRALINYVHQFFISVSRLSETVFSRPVFLRLWLVCTGNYGVG